MTVSCEMKLVGLRRRDRMHRTNQLASKLGRGSSLLVLSGAMRMSVLRQPTWQPLFNVTMRLGEL